MATICKAYPTENLARQGVRALMSAGVPGRDIRLVAGFPLRDRRPEPQGGFARAIGPDAPVGSFAGVPRSRREAHGCFASVPATSRLGSFADVDLDVIVRYDGAVHRHVVGDVGLRRTLMDAGVRGAACERILEELHVGHAAVLAQLPEVRPRDAEARLEQVTRVA